MKQWIQNLVCPLVLATLVGTQGSSSGPSCPSGGQRQSGFRDGEFRVTVVGVHRGSGTAEVDDNEVSLSCQLTTGTGAQVRLEAHNMQTIGPYFAGNGTLGSTRVHISGRLDLVKASRMVATYIAEDGRAGRIVGLLPNEPSNPNWHTSDSRGHDDDDDDDDDDHHDD